MNTENPYCACGCGEELVPKPYWKYPSYSSTRFKVGHALKGKSRMGHPAWNKGKTLSIEHRKKLSLAKKGFPRKNCPDTCTCKRHSIAKCQIGCNCQKHIAPKLYRERVRRGVQAAPIRYPAKISLPEQLLINLIREKSLPYKYTGDRKFWIEKVNPDFVNTNGEKIAIEVQGCYWHACPICKCRQQDRAFEEAREKKRWKVYLKYGWKVIEIWEHQFLETDWKFKVLSLL